MLFDSDHGALFGDEWWTACTVAVVICFLEGTARLFCPLMGASHVGTQSSVASVLCQGSCSMPAAKHSCSSNMHTLHAACLYITSRVMADVNLD